MNDIVSDIMNDKNGHNIVKDNFAHYLHCWIRTRIKTWI